jgi:hypothetical protein
MIPEQIQNMIDSNAKFLIAFSGGKDSVAMYLYIRYQLGIENDRIELHHHEVDGQAENFFDWPCTTSYCSSFADSFGVDLLFSYRKGGIKREILRESETVQPVYYQQKPKGEFIEIPSKNLERFYSTRYKFPAVSADLRTRWCSGVVKIDVLSRVVSNNPAYKVGDFIICTGERRAESTARSKYAEVEKYRAYSQKRNAILWRPVIDWSDEQVWAIIEKHKVQAHPAYMLGWSRCSCMTCIFSSPNTWASLNEINPLRVLSFRALEIKINHTLYHKITLKEKVQKGTSFVDKNTDQYWINQALGEFTAPIITNEWTLPRGAKSKEVTGAN